MDSSQVLVIIARTPKSIIAKLGGDTSKTSRKLNSKQNWLLPFLTSWTKVIFPLSSYIRWLLTLQTENTEADQQSKSQSKSSQSMKIDSLVPSPMFQYTAYPTPSGGVLRSRSPQGKRGLGGPKDLEKSIAPVSFEPPFNTVSSKLY